MVVQESVRFEEVGELVGLAELGGVGVRAYSRLRQ